KIEDRQKHVSELVQDWIDFDGGPRGVSPKDLDVRLRFDEGKGDVTVNSAPGAKQRGWTFGGAPPIWGEETWLWPGMRLDATTTLSAPEVGDFEKDRGFSAGGWMQVRFNPTAIGDVNSGSLISRLDQPHASRGWE